MQTYSLSASYWISNVGGIANSLENRMWMKNLETLKKWSEINSMEFYRESTKHFTWERIISYTAVNWIQLIRQQFCRELPWVYSKLWPEHESTISHHCKNKEVNAQLRCTLFKTEKLIFQTYSVYSWGGIFLLVSHFKMWTNWRESREQQRNDIRDIESMKKYWKNWVYLVWGRGDWEEIWY